MSSEGPALDVALDPLEPVLLPGADLHVTVPKPGRLGRITAVNRDGSRVACVVTQDASGVLAIAPAATA